MNNHTTKLTPRITLFIPAYNNPEYTKKALWSIASQSYDLLDVILVDDCSPDSLRGIASEFSNYINSRETRIRFTYIRNTSNQGAYNVYNSYSLVRTQWAFQFPHDDWFCDNDVITRWVTYIQRNPELTAVIGHTRLENCIAGDSADNATIRMIGKGQLPSYLTEDGPFAWSAILFDNQKLRRIPFPSREFCIFPDDHQELLPDDLHSPLILLSLEGPTLIDYNVVSVRGLPDTAYTKTEKRCRYLGNSSFYIHISLLRYAARNRHSWASHIAILSHMFYWTLQNDERFRPVLACRRVSTRSFLLYIIFFLSSRLRLNKLMAISFAKISDILAV